MAYTHTHTHTHIHTERSINHMKIVIVSLRGNELSDSFGLVGNR